MLKYKLHRLSAIVVLCIMAAVLIQSFMYISIDSKNSKIFNEDVSTRMHRKHQILKRGCSMVKSLFEMSQVGFQTDALSSASDWFNFKKHQLDSPKCKLANINLKIPLRMGLRLRFFSNGIKESKIFHIRFQYLMKTNVIHQ